ncbi:BLUF domain-containing protein [Shewanella aestuarii]|uniref:BLUF domain-containing protein n=1 Tax=Shewanella aestuarii TaxID=1028752 RepID=A0A6G9QLC8_9GAMM|nr:BLUF domain-containing protein [Shewanella aestuarii]QIR14669.1 BLUF domain-containing protein [Shewanella aestuarii]
MYLTRLIYASSVTGIFNESSLEDILKKARLHNAKQGITGMLCFSNNYFIQCLEGSRESVNETYNKILKDTRHSNIVIIDYSEICSREFSSWDMAYVPATKNMEPINLKFTTSTEFNPYNISGSAAFLMLLELRNNLISV